MIDWLRKMFRGQEHRGEDLHYLCIDCQTLLRRHYADSVFGSRLIYYCPNCDTKIEVLDPKKASQNPCGK